MTLSNNKAFVSDVSLIVCTEVLDHIVDSVVDIIDSSHHADCGKLQKPGHNQSHLLLGSVLAEFLQCLVYPFYFALFKLLYANHNIFGLFFQLLIELFAY